MKPFKIVDVNQGHGQITYATRNLINQRIFYCLQDNGKNFGGIRFMRCTQDGEPQNAATLHNKSLLEIPVGDSELEELCRQWIKT